MKDTSDDVIKEYIETNGIRVRSFACVSNDLSMYKSFKLEISVSDMEKVLNADFWPTGVWVRRFYSPKGSRNVTNSPYE